MSDDNPVDTSAPGDPAAAAAAMSHRSATAVADGSAPAAPGRDNPSANGSRVNGRTQGGDSETTASLPVVGADNPYVDRNARAARGSAGKQPVASARPAPSAPAPLPPASFPPVPGSPGASDPAGPARSSATTGSAGSARSSASAGAAGSAGSVSPGGAGRPAGSSGRLPTGSAAAVAAAPAPPLPRSTPSAVDQYGALGLSGGAGLAGSTAASASAATAASTATTGSTAATVGTAAPPGFAAPTATAGTLATANPGAESSAGPAVARPARRGRGERTPRRARLQLRHFNVWTVFKFSVVLAVALFFVWMIVVAVLYGTLDHLKVIDNINKTVRTIENDSSTNDAVTPRIIFTSAFLIGLVNIVLFIVLTTIGAVVYNLCADLVGGIEVTLAERD